MATFQNGIDTGTNFNQHLCSDEGNEQWNLQACGQILSWQSMSFAFNTYGFSGKNIQNKTEQTKSQQVKFSLKKCI